MLIFWVVVGGLTAAAAALILARAAGSASLADAVDPSSAVYRRQLAEIDELAERGLIGEAERQGAQVEAGRRLLAAANTPAQIWSDDGLASRLTLLAVAIVLALTLGLYWAVGSPGFPDMPYAQRLAAWRSASPERLAGPEIAAVMRESVRENPDDAEGLRLLALAEGTANNSLAAVRAMRQAVAVAPERADLRRLLGEALIYKAGGKIDADAQAAFREALKLEPGDVSSRFYLAEAKAEMGRGAEAATELRGLLADMPADDRRRGAVETALANAEGRSAPPRPRPEGMAAIQGMVEGLAARLEAQPDDPEGWVRLVRSYAVLDDAAKRDAALAAARARYASAPEILGKLEEAARAAPMR